MLGLMSIMALTTIGISIEQRRMKEDHSTVELVGIPADFIPFHIRCRKNTILWLDNDQQWRETSILGMITDLSETSNTWGTNQKKSTLLDFIIEKVEENKRLSLSKKQNSVILWVEPEGIESALILQYLISDRKLPLRVGLLPILEDEAIYPGTTHVK